MQLEKLDLISHHFTTATSTNVIINKESASITPSPSVNRMHINSILITSLSASFVSIGLLIMLVCSVIAFVSVCVIKKRSKKGSLQVLHVMDIYKYMLAFLFIRSRCHSHRSYFC